MTATPIITTGSLPVEVGHRSGVVSLEIGRGTRIHFDPKAAAELGQRLIDEAKNSIHADRLDRRKS